MSDFAPYGSNEAAEEFVTNGLGFEVTDQSSYYTCSVHNTRTGEQIHDLPADYWALFILGYIYGKEIASFQDTPEQGRDIDEVEEQFLDRAYDAEENSRQFTPFEHIAAAINSREDHEEAWQAYDEGIARGIKAEWEERAPQLFDEEE